MRSTAAPATMRTPRRRQRGRIDAGARSACQQIAVPTALMTSALRTGSARPSRLSNGRFSNRRA